MYGTVARMRIKPGAREEFDRAMEKQSATVEHLSGFICAYLYSLDSGPHDVVLCVVYDSRASYVANSRAPETHESYLEMRACLVAEPEWSDGEVLPVMRFK